ncbi:S9 family peptidase [Haloferacaceae archaeon DSL9]
MGTIDSATPSYKPTGRDDLRMYRRDIRDTTNDSLLADLAAVDSVVQAIPDPTGERIAYAKTREGRTDLWLLDDGADARLTSEGVVAMRYGRGDSQWFDWSPDGDRLAYLAADGTLSVVDAATGEKTAVTRWDDADLGLAWHPTDDRIAVVTDHFSRASLAVVAVDGSQLTVLADDDYLYDDPKWCGDDVVAVRSAHRHWFDYESELVRVPGDGSDDPEPLFYEAGVRVQCPRPRPGSVEVAFVHDGAGFDGLYLVEPESEPEALLTVEAAEVADPAWHPDGDRIAATTTQDARVNVRVVTRDGDVSVLTDEDAVHSAPRWLGETVITTRDTPTTTPAVWHVGDERRLSPGSTAGLESRLVDAEELTYESVGEEIHAVVLPPAADAPPQSVPLLVKPHGGPTSHDTFGFDYRAQYFATLGYAVIMPNYRGSDGYGRAFRMANDGDWGGGDLRDVIAAVDAAANAYDAIDGSRVGIFGGSGGGLMTVNALGHSDRFRAGAAFYGVYDYESFVDDTDDIGWMLLKRELGSFVDDPFAYRDASPIRSVDDIEDPLLVIHGEADRRVPISQSEQLVDELERAGKRHEFRRYADEPHGFGDRENVVDAYTRTADLFAKYLRVDPDDGSSRPHPPVEE